MFRASVLRRVVLPAAAALLALVPAASPQFGPRPVPRGQPRLEPVAETKLLMEGLAQANFKGLDRLLQKKPADVQTWTFARGQALLIAETGNLLMLRPPRNEGEAAWLQRATELREAATALARSAAARDYDASQRGLVNVANACNRCHQTFRVPVEIAPFEERDKGRE
jgi:hypothetical protein